jgi:hypothetical protein
MALTIRKMRLWRGEVANRPGELARVLEPLARARADLKVIMGYRIPGQRERAVIEVAPIIGARMASAAAAGGLGDGGAPTLLVQGDNRPALGHRIARALADSGVNIAFIVAQVVGRRYSAVFGFESEADLDKAAQRIRLAAAARRRA